MGLRAVFGDSPLSSQLDAVAAAAAVVPIVLILFTSPLMLLASSFLVSEFTMVALIRKEKG